MALKIQQLRIAVGVTVHGEAKLLYLGGDTAKCDKAVADAGQEFEVAAALPRGVTPLVARYPAREAANDKASREASRVRVDAAEKAKRSEAEAKAAQGKKLVAEAAATLKELSKSDK